MPSKDSGKTYTKQQIIDAYACDDVSGLQTLVSKLGISRARVLSYLDQYQISAPRKPSKYKKDVPDKATLEEMYANKSLKQIAEHFGASQPTVARWLTQHGIASRDGKQARALSASKSFKLQSNPAARDLFTDKQWCIDTFVIEQQPIQTVCRRLKVAEPTARMILREHGILEMINQKRADLVNQAAQQYIAGQTFPELLDQYSQLQHTEIRQEVVRLGQPIRTSNSYARKFVNRSSYELIICGWLDEWGIDYRTSDRSILCGRELDIVVDSRKLAIEVNGVVFHSEQWGKDRNYHVDKTNDAVKLGYSLIHVWEDEIVQRPAIVKSIIASKLGRLSNRVFARNTQIVSLDKNQKRAFLDANHIQGNDTSTINYGLVCGDKIVALMTFRVPRFNHEAMWELVRYCNLLDSTVVGGFSKLLKHFRSIHAGSIVSYSDNGRSRGDVYQRNGFVLLSDNPAGYYYVQRNNIARHHRASFTKKKLLSKLGIDDETLTETQLAEIARLLRVWDSGSKTWILE